MDHDAIGARPRSDEQAARVVPLKSLDLAYVPRRWPFAENRKDEIDAHFAALKRAKPALWNGEVLMLGARSVAEEVFTGSYFPVSYASFLAWRDWGYPDQNVWDCFAMGAIRGSDGAFVLGEMAPSTANPGLIYFPCGTPDRNDIVADKVDLEGSIKRELMEETGLDIAEFAADAGWVTVFAGPWIANFKLLQSRDTAAVLRQRLVKHLARQDRPELADIRIVRGPADIGPMIPPHVVAYLRHAWRQYACA